MTPAIDREIAELELESELADALEAAGVLPEVEPMFTHVIEGHSRLGYVQSHHRGTAKGKRHAVNAPGLRIASYQRTETLCGATVEIEEDERIATVVYNCWPTTNAGIVTCKKCRKKLGV